MIKQSLILISLIIIGFLGFNYFTGYAQTTDGVLVNVDVTEEDEGGGTNYGCTDPEATNYDSSADVNNNTCTYNQGCTDPGADNFSPLEEGEDPRVDDGSCLYIPNVTQFEAVYNPSLKGIDLSWKNPVYSYFEAVRLVRTEARFSVGPEDGILIYDGGGEQIIDFEVDPDILYFYTIYARSTASHYASGVIDIEIFSLKDDVCDPSLEDCDEEPPDEDCDPSVEDCGPFDDLPDAPPDPEVEEDLLKLDFIFSQTNKSDQYLVKDGGTIYLNGVKPFVVYVPAELVPSVLKTIAMTLYYPGDSRRTFSFILRLNETKNRYEANINPLKIDGTYKVRAFMFDLKTQTLKKIDGKIIIKASLVNQFGTLVETPLAVASETAVILGTISILLQSLFATSLLSRWADLPLFLWRLLEALLALLGLRKRKDSWGTVYDSVTKRPLDPAYVEALDANSRDSIKSAITDLDGRYSFILPFGNYFLSAKKTNYQFPSRKLMGKTEDEIYNNLYFGEPFSVESGNIIARNIPLDPLNFDWNEFAKNRSHFFQIYSRGEFIRYHIFNVIYIVGFILAIGNLILSPSLNDIVILIIYVGLFGLGRLWQIRRKPAQIKNLKTGEPMSFAVIRLYLAGTDTEVKTVVADEMGRFHVLVRPDEYYYTVEEKLTDGSYEKVYASAVVNLKRGVLQTDLNV